MTFEVTPFCGEYVVRLEKIPLVEDLESIGSAAAARDCVVRIVGSARPRTFAQTAPDLWFELC